MMPEFICSKCYLRTEGTPSTTSGECWGCAGLPDPKTVDPDLFSEPICEQKTTTTASKPATMSGSMMGIWGLPTKQPDFGDFPPAPDDSVQFGSPTSVDYERLLESSNKQSAMLMPRAKETTVGEAIDILRQSFVKDATNAWPWQCSLACAAMDEQIPHEQANRIARRFMQMAFGVTPKEPNAYVPQPYSRNIPVIKGNIPDARSSGEKARDNHFDQVTRLYRMPVEDTEEMKCRQFSADITKQNQKAKEDYLAAWCAVKYPNGVAVGNDSKFTVPHFAQFAAIVNYASRSYNWTVDEAIHVAAKDQEQLDREYFADGVV